MNTELKEQMLKYNPNTEDLGKPELWEITPEDTLNRYEKFAEYPDIYQALNMASSYERKKIKLICRTAYNLRIPTLDPLNRFIIEDFIKNVPKADYTEEDWVMELQDFKWLCYSAVIGLFQLAVLQEDFKMATIMKKAVEEIVQIKDTEWVEYDDTDFSDLDII